MRPASLYSRVASVLQHERQAERPRASMIVRISTIRVSLACLVAIAAAGSVGDARADLLLYTPEWSPGNLGVLSAAVERYLSESDLDMEFQAFARYEDFLRELRQRDPDFLSAPAWVEDEERLALTALARPLRDGRPSYRKVLLVGPSIVSTADLASASIALTAHGGDDTVLESVLRSVDVERDGVTVLPVPKDIDALLALGFGQVDAALVSTGQLAHLARVSPRTADRLKPLAVSGDIPFPLVYASTFASDQVTAGLVRGLADIEDSASGEAVLELLGYDAIEILVPSPARLGSSHRSASTATTVAEMAR